MTKNADFLIILAKQNNVNIFVFPFAIDRNHNLHRLCNWMTFCICIGNGGRSLCGGLIAKLHVPLFICNLDP